MGEDRKNDLIALEQIVETANHLNDPVEFTAQVAEILLENELISASVYDVLTGQL